MREPTLTELGEDIHELRDAVRLLTEAISLTYLRQDVYQAQRESLMAQEKSTRAIAMWALALVCGLVIAALVSFVASVSGAGPT